MSSQRWSAGPLTDPLTTVGANAAASSGDAGQATQAQAVDAAISSGSPSGQIVAVVVVSAALSTGGAGQATDMRQNVVDLVGAALSQGAGTNAAGGYAPGPALSSSFAPEPQVFFTRRWPEPRTARQGQLGCGTNEAWLVDRKGRRTKLHVAALSYQYSIDKAGVGSAACTLTNNPVLQSARNWVHEVEFTRDGQAVWVGPLIGTRFDPATGIVTIGALDLTGWASVTAVKTARSYLNMDWVHIVQHLLMHDALDGVRVDGVEVYPSYVYGSLVIGANELRYVVDAVKGGEAVLDTVAWNRRIIIDGRLPAQQPRVGLITDKDLGQRPQVWTDGMQQPDVVFVKGANGVVGRYPAEGSPTLRDVPHPVESVVDRSDLTSQSEVEAAAAARWRSQPATYHIDLGQGQLLPKAAVTFDKLVPGAIVRAVVSALGETVATSQRIAEVTVKEEQSTAEVVTASFTSVTE